MSTLPFLLSVADELDNINSQSYLDDFGLGFHPHRQYYRTPTIQLSLPASAEWQQQQEQGHRHHSRYRSAFRYYGEPHNNLEAHREGEEAYDVEEELQKDEEHNIDGDGDNVASCSSSASAMRTKKFVSALNPNTLKLKLTNDEDNVDNSVQLYNISKKCSKDYYRQREQPSISSASSTSASIASSKPPLPPRGTPSCSSHKEHNKAQPTSTMSYRLHAKCLEGNNSSSEESLQKVSSSIEFLTCFLLKKTRVNKASSSSPSDPEGRKT